MATMQSALFPCSSLLNDTSSFCKLNEVRLLNFKDQSSISSSRSFSGNSTSKPNTLQAQISLSADNTRSICHHPRVETRTDFDICHCLLSFLNNELIYDCRQIHAAAVKLNAFEVDCVIGNKLAVLYCKKKELFGCARQLFDEIPKRTRPGYLALINTYCWLEQWEDFFWLLGLMVSEGLFPDKYLVPTVLKACSALKLSRKGKMLHGYITRKDLNSDIFVGNSLIDFYANCGELRSSSSVFYAMREKDVVSWTTLVSAYLDVGLLDYATEVFHSMQLNGVKPDLISWNALVSGFARNGEIDLALQYLEEMQEMGVKPRVNTWNGIISGCVQNKYFEDALDAFYSMLWYPETPNSVTIASILPACAGLENLNLGEVFHGYALRHQLCGNIHVEGSLIDMYLKCGRTDNATKIFYKAENKNTTMWNEMIAAFVNVGNMKKAMELLRLMQNDGPKPDVISFNTMLAGHARVGQKYEAYKLLSEMVQMGLSPNVVSCNILISGFQQSGQSYVALKLFQDMQSSSNGSFFSDMFPQSARPNSITTTSALTACAYLNLKRQGKEIHGYTLRIGFECNTYVSCALVHMYSKCGDIVSATKVFKKIDDRNTRCWNAFIAGHVNNMHPGVAFTLFSEMLAEVYELSKKEVKLAHLKDPSLI
ncbi:pentatricopeptide repeat-containing protein At1g19720-like isoform X2 [Humulus lupulus]|uniref:pentatricopeptide repeat-containing protein At1g19720-like isoform X2 n=1 Tax=Humulus lupulus TaxID=3486 RepID=UPI002B4075E8|nr:pentatricopeptide repeat-containing protein At1g19720-like isoform X2 [Humulus lupulus]